MVSVAADLAAGDGGPTAWSRSGQFCGLFAIWPFGSRSNSFSGPTVPETGIVTPGFDRPSVSYANVRAWRIS